MAGKQFIIAHYIYPKIYFLTVAYIPLSSAKRVKVTELDHLSLFKGAPCLLLS